MQEHLFDTLVRDSQYAPATRMQVAALRLINYPTVSPSGNHGQAAVALAVCVTTEEQAHTVVVRYLEIAGESDFEVWCGDRFIEGHLDLEAARRLAQRAAGHLFGDVAGREASPGADRLTNSLLGGYNALPGERHEHEGCDFWRQGLDRQSCAHVSHALTHLRDTRPQFKLELRERYASLVANAIASVA